VVEPLLFADLHAVEANDAVVADYSAFARIATAGKVRRLREVDRSGIPTASVNHVVTPVDS
jgi:hypothetical protein